MGKKGECIKSNKVTRNKHEHILSAGPTVYSIVPPPLPPLPHPPRCPQRLSLHSKVGGVKEEEKDKEEEEKEKKSI